MLKRSRLGKQEQGRSVAGRDSERGTDGGVSLSLSGLWKHWSTHLISTLFSLVRDLGIQFPLKTFPMIKK